MLIDKPCRPLVSAQVGSLCAEMPSDVIQGLKNKHNEVAYASKGSCPTNGT